MKHILFYNFIIPLLIFSCNRSPVKNNNDTFENWVITSHGLGKIELGESISIVKSEFIKKGFEIEPFGNGSLGFDLLDKKKHAVKVSPLKNEIYAIEIYSNRFSTASGFTVGMTIKEIKKIYSDFSPSMDQHNGRVYFEPKEMQTQNSRFTIQFRMKDDSAVWKFVKAPNGDHFNFSPIGKVDEQAIVEVIQIVRI